MIANAQIVIFVGLYLIVFVMSVVALADALMRAPKAFVDGGKRTKGFWVGLLGVATAVAFVAIPWPIGIGQLSFLALGSAVGAGVYLADVKPAVARYSGGRGRPGGSGRPSGGW